MRRPRHARHRAPLAGLAVLALVLAAPAAQASPVVPMVPLGHDGPAVSAAWDPGGARVLTLGEDRTARLWLADGGHLLAVLRLDRPPVRAAWQPDGQRVAVWDDEGAVTVWAPASGERLAPTGEEAGWPEAARTSPDGRLRVEVEGDGSVTIRGTRTALTLGAGPAPVRALSWSAQGLRSVHGDGLDMEWTAPTGRPRATTAARSDGLRHVSTLDDLTLTGSTEGPARLWDQGGNLLHEFSGHSGPGTAIAWSPGGQRVATSSADGTVRLWDATDGSQVRVIDLGRPLSRVAWASDARHLAAVGRDDGSLSIVTVTGELLASPTVPGGARDVAWSPDGRRLLTAGGDGLARAWDGETGAELFALKGPGEALHRVSWAGQLLAAGTEDGRVRTWEATEGRQLLDLDLDGERLGALAWDPRAQQLAAGTSSGEIVIWSDQGQRLRTLSGHAATVRELSWSQRDQRLLSLDARGKARTWKRRKSEDLRIPAAVAATAAAWSPDGRRIAAIGQGGTGLVTEPDRRKARRVAIDGHPGPVPAVALVAGELAVTGGEDRMVRLWDLDGRAMKTRLPGHKAEVRDLAAAPDGSWIASGGADGAVLLWAPEGKLRDRHEAGGPVSALAASASGDLLAVGLDGGQVQVLDPERGRLLATFDGLEGDITGLAFSPDGTTVAAVDDRGGAATWPTAGGPARLSLSVDEGPLAAVAWSPDGTRLVTGGGTVRIWSADTGQPVVALAVDAEGGWVVFDEAGRFDRDSRGEELFYWVLGDEVIGLSQLRSRYSEPGLLAQHLGWSPEPLAEVPPIEALDLFPAVDISEPAGPRRTVRITVRDRGGGIGRTLVAVNGSDVTDQLRQVQATDQEQQLELDLAGLPYVAPDGENRVTATAFNAEGYLSSRGITALVAPKDQAPADPPRFWGIVVGTHDYRGSELDLSFPASDAAAMYEALTLSAQGLFGAERTDIRLLTTRPGDTPPTRDNLEAAFARLAQAAPQDVVTIYLAGHGFNYDGDRGEDYFYATPALASVRDLDDPAARRAGTVSGTELQQWLLASPAGKRVVVLDTCSSGQLIEVLGGAGRSVAADQSRAFERMRDRTGTYVLAGAAADAVSYEASQYGQGVLTYALLEGMRGAALNKGYVDVNALFQYARERVPQLAEGIGGIQTPVLEQPGAGSFDIGLLSTDAREAIPLRAERPVVVQSTFVEVGDSLEDPLGLSNAVDLQLQGWSGADAPGVYIDVEDYPSAYRLTGQYLVGTSGLTVAARVEVDDTIVAGLLLEEVDPTATATTASDLAWAAGAWLERRDDPASILGSQEGRVWILDHAAYRDAVAEVLEGAERDRLPGWLAWLSRTGPCADPTYRTDLSRAVGQARLAYAQQKVERFHQAVREAQGVLPCMAEPLEDDDVEALHQVMGLAAWSDGARDIAVPYLVASHPDPLALASTDPDDPLSVTLGQARADLLDFAVDDGRTMPPAARGRLSVDGQLGTRQPPANTPYVFQRTTRQRVLQTTYVEPGEDRPRYPRLRRRLLLTGAVSGLTAAGLYLAGDAVGDSLLDPGQEARDWDQDEVDRRLALNHGLLVGSGVGAAVGAGAFLGLGLSYFW